MSEFPSSPTGFRFRNVHPALYMGTMSDRYAGWLGQIYTPEKYQGRISSRTKKLGGNAPLIAQRIAREFTAGEDGSPRPGPS